VLDFEIVISVAQLTISADPGICVREEGVPRVSSPSLPPFPFPLSLLPNSK